MASPALFWNYRTIDLGAINASRQDVHTAAKQLMQSEGLTSLATSPRGVLGRTPNGTAFIATITKAPPPTGPLSGTYIVLFVAAGDGAKDVRDGLVAAWDKLTWI